ncbi:MAG TPA: hypothetical protein VK656_05320, partial [Candidatus Acidoferrum sp.]|nr:hypothetical protein [Candidatus Acidoferrum sp.]
RIAEGFVAFGLVAAIGGAALWSGLTPGASPHGGLPHGGPAGSYSGIGTGGAAGASGGGGGFSAGTAGGFPGGVGVGGATAALTRYLEANRGTARWVLAVPDAMTAATFIVQADLPVMAVGGFTGGDRVLSVDEFATLVQRGEVRFVLSQGRRGGENGKIFAWASEHCQRATGSPVSGLLDCGALAGAGAGT